MIFALKPTFIPIENESHFWITPRKGVSRCFLKQLEMVSHKWSQFPYFFLIQQFCFSTWWTNEQIASNNGCTDTLPNKLFNASHMQMRQHFPNLIYKTLHQYKNFFSYVGCHQSTTTYILYFQRFNEYISTHALINSITIT